MCVYFCRTYYKAVCAGGGDAVLLFWTLESASRLRGYPEGRKSCQQDAPRWSRRSSQRSSSPPSVCSHQPRRSQCKQCGGAGICQHQRQRFNCKECGRAESCQYQRRRSRYKESRGRNLPAPASKASERCTLSGSPPSSTLSSTGIVV